MVTFYTMVWAGSVNFKSSSANFQTYTAVKGRHL